VTQDIGSNAAKKIHIALSIGVGNEYSFAFYQGDGGFAVVIL
jgi:hypothetical protein